MSRWQKNKKRKAAIGKCNECQISFDWALQGLANGKGEEYCGYNCFQRNLERVQQARNSGDEFDML